MSKHNKIILNVPENIHTNSQTKTNDKQKNIEKYKKLVELQYNEISQYQYEAITDDNIIGIEKIVLAAEDLISNCMNDEAYYGNKDDKFINLTFCCQKISLKLEAYRINKKYEQLNEKSKEIEIKVNEAEERNNNLVYNLLSFLTAFSIVSAVVGVIADINGILNIMIFITFTLLILMTTLIGLHNFYKKDNKRESKCQDNYFLWKFLFVMLAVLVISVVIKNICENKEFFMHFFDNAIERRVDEIMLNKYTTP